MHIIPYNDFSSRRVVGIGFLKIKKHPLDLENFTRNPQLLNMLVRFV